MFKSRSQKQQTGFGFFIVGQILSYTVQNILTSSSVVEKQWKFVLYLRTKGVQLRRKL